MSPRGKYCCLQRRKIPLNPLQGEPFRVNPFEKGGEKAIPLIRVTKAFPP